MISVQVLRAIAALLVVMVHTTLKAQSMGIGSRVFELGHAGVDLFFIISGFIMMMIGAKENKFPIFISKRIVRVIPLYYIITTFALAVYLFNPSLIKGNQDGITILNSYLLLPTEGKSFLLSVGWTLSYEMFFYIVFSLTLFINSSMKGIAASMILAVLVVYGRYAENEVLRNFMSPILLEFAIGIFCFYIYKKVGPLLSKKRRVIVSSVLALSAAAYILSDSDPLFTLFENRVIDLATPMMMIFLAFCFSEQSFQKYKNNIFTKLFSYIGDASYSLYLTHLFTLGFISKIFNIFGVDNNYLFVFCCLVSSVIVGVACYEIIEKKVSIALKSAVFRKEQVIK